MMERDSHKDVDEYGFWPWIAGVAFAGFVIFVMFALSASIS